MMKRFLRDLILSVAWYLCLVVVGTLVALLVCRLIGYLPYSDRPGPGWGSPSFSLAELWFFISWALLLLPYAALWALGIFLFGRLLAWLWCPRWLLILSGALLAGYVSLTLVDAFGWYIAIAAAPVYTSCVLGIVWGAIVLPRYVGLKVSAARPSLRRQIALVCAYGGTGALIYWLFFFQPYSQQLEVTFVRIVETSGVGTEGNAPKGLTPIEQDFLTKLKPAGSIHWGIESFSSGSDRNKARALIITRGPLEGQVALPQPKATSVVYLQHGTRWEMSPPDAPTLKRKIRFEQSGKTSGTILVHIDPGDEGTEFTWYPPIEGPQ
jgi:hypothetical protein